MSFSNNLEERVADFIVGNSDESVEDLLDEIQILYNEDLLSGEDYFKYIEQLEGFLYTELEIVNKVG